MVLVISQSQIRYVVRHQFQQFMIPFKRRSYYFSNRNWTDYTQRANVRRYYSVLNDLIHEDNNRLSSWVQRGTLTRHLQTKSTNDNMEMSLKDKQSDNGTRNTQIHNIDLVGIKNEDIHTENLSLAQDLTGTNSFFSRNLDPKNLTTEEHIEDNLISKAHTSDAQSRTNELSAVLNHGSQASRISTIKSSLGYYEIIINDKGLYQAKPYFKAFVYAMDPTTLSNFLSQNYCYDALFSKRPRIGSLVEVRDEHSGDIHFGVVIEEQRGNFHDELSRIRVFTVKGEYLLVRAVDISFHLHKFFDPKKVNQIFFPVLENIYGNQANIDVIDYQLDEKSNKEILVIRNLMIYYIKGSLNLLKILDSRHFDEIAFSKLARQNSLNGMTIDDYINEIPIFSQNMSLFKESLSLLSQNKLNKIFIYFSTYIALANRPENYMMIINRDNFIYEEENQFSNYVPNVRFATHSNHNSLLLRTVLNNPKFDEKLSLFSDEVRNLLSADINEENKFYKWINGSIFLTNEENTMYDAIIDLFKLYIVYPHEVLGERLKLILSQVKTSNTDLRCFASITDEILISPDIIFDFLKYFGIYREDTDIYLSNNFLFPNKSSSPSKSISSMSQLLARNASKDLNFSNTYSFSRDATVQEDSFGHARYVRNTPVYGIPFVHGLGENLTDMAVSLTDIDAKNLVVNIHIPDIGSFIHPGSELIYNLLLNGTDLRAPNGVLNYMPKSVINSFAFKTTTKHGEVSEFSSTAKGYNCLTFSFSYDIWEKYQFEFGKLKVDVRAEFLENVKVLNTAQLNDVLSNQMEFFGLFHSERQDYGNDVHLFKREKEALRQIFNICKRVSYARSNEFALESEISSDEHYPKFRVEESLGEIKYIKPPEQDVRLKLFVREIKLLANELAARYAIQHKLPVYHHSQSVINSYYDSIDNSIGVADSKPADYRTVVPENYLLPSFKAFEYEHFTFGKLEGNVLPTSYFSGLNFLNKPKISFDPGKEMDKYLTESIIIKSELGADDKSPEYNKLSHRKLGLRYGYVKVASPFSGLEQLVNQWQFLLSINSNMVYNFKLSKSKKYMPYYNRLKIKGFPDGPFTEQQIKNLYGKYVARRNIVIKELQQKMNKYWVLRYLQQEVKRSAQNPGFAPMFIFKCVVTQSAQYPNLASAYCLELGIHVKVQLTSSGEELIVGDQIICSKVNELVPVEGTLVLGI